MDKINGNPPPDVVSAWFDFAATGNDWELERLRHLVGQQDSLGRTALMHYVENGWYKRIYLLAGEIHCLDAKGDNALTYAQRAHNDEAVHRISMLLADAQTKRRKQMYRVHTNT